MPFATTHILTAIILIELFREYFIKDNKKFPRYYILIAAIGSILPDFDIGIYYILYFFGFSFWEVHKTILHSVFIPIGIIFIGIFLRKYRVKDKKLGKHHIKWANIFLILGIFSLLHLLLDMIVYDILLPFYPISSVSFGLKSLDYFPIGIRDLIMPTLDAILLILWIFWMEFKLKITKYV